MTAYAVLGWGSLIWDLGELAPHVRLPWQMGAGPALPMEFCRVSAKRANGLVVCLDAEHGVPCPTHALRSRRRSLGAAVADLARRERAPKSRIGGVCLATGAVQGRADIAERIALWCEAEGWLGAVWTDLRGNFEETAGTRFSVERGVAYLKDLPGPSLDEAVRYIALAPETTATPLREALAGDPWWGREVARVLGEAAPGGCARSPAASAEDEPDR